MDKLEFIIEDKQSDSYQFKVVKIIINNTDLIDKLREYELPFTRKECTESIAGSYDGLSPETLFKYLTNPGEFDKDENDKVSILECECGCEGCWPMKVKINIADNEVVWTDFEQPHRGLESNNHWDYLNFGQFTFNKQNYDDQINKLRLNLFPATSLIEPIS